MSSPESYLPHPFLEASQISFPQDARLSEWKRVHLCLIMSQSYWSLKCFPIQTLLDNFSNLKVSVSFCFFLCKDKSESTFYKIGHLTMFLVLSFLLPLTT